MRRAVLQLRDRADQWLERIGELFHLHRLRAEAWQPRLPLGAQDGAFAAIQQRLAATVETLFADAGAELRRVKAELERTPPGLQHALPEARRAPRPSPRRSTNVLAERGWSLDPIPADAGKVHFDTPFVPMLAGAGNAPQVCSVGRERALIKEVVASVDRYRETS